MFSLSHQKAIIFARTPTRRQAICLGLMAVGVLALVQPGPRVGLTAQAAPTAAANKEQAVAAYGKLPLAFVPNKGQTDARVRFSARASGASFWFTGSEAVFAFAGKKGEQALRLGFVGANPNVEIEPGRRGASRVNYLVGSDPSKWRTGLPTYGEVVYRALWPGIDLAFSGKGGKLKYEFRLAPRANVSDIRLVYRGARKLSIGRAGDLRIHTAGGALRDSRPVTYQMIGGTSVPVESRFVLRSGAAYGFAVGHYDSRRALVIDPGLLYSTYLGGSDADPAEGVAVDAAGAAYVTGITRSVNFPTLGAVQSSYAGGEDAFVTKLNPTGSTLVYSTYLGGGGIDHGQGIAVDAAGNAYVAGLTQGGFPTTAGAFQTTFQGGFDAFVTKLNPTGSALVWSTYLGGTSTDTGNAIAIDAAGNTAVTGNTGSINFPTLAAFQSSYQGGFDGYVAKLNAVGSGLIYSSYLGGSSGEASSGVKLDTAGNAYVTGRTQSSNFPTTAGAFQPTFGGFEDAFVTKVSPTGLALLYSTYLGGTLDDLGFGVAVDTAGNAYVTGQTSSSNFPTMPGAFQTANSGGYDAFVTKLNTTGMGVYSTYLGGNNGDGGFGIAVDGLGSAHVIGQTLSSNFPTLGAAQSAYAGNGDAFVTKLNATGSVPLYSTYLGGANSDVGTGIALDAVGNVYAVGYTSSTNFPTTAGAFRTTFGGVTDAFVAKLATLGAPVPAVLTLSPVADSNPVGTSHTVTATVTDAGGNPVSGVTVRFTVTGSVNTSGFCTTDAAGQCDFTYLGPTTPGSDVISAFADSDGDGTLDPGEPTGGATKAWVPGAPATVVLMPTADANPVGTSHTVTATVTDAFGNPISGIKVRFTVSGSVNTSGACTTDVNGQCDFTYQGPELPGADAITAYADSDNDGMQDPGEPSGAATKSWVVPLSTPGCEVTIADNGRITAANGDKAVFHGHAKVSSPDVSGTQSYEDLGPAQPFTMESTNILAVVCSADRTEATIFGDATINGSGSFHYRIRVKDLGEPGKFVDQYGILLSNGYFSGDKFLEAGNVQITVHA